MHGKIEAAFIGVCGRDAETRLVRGGELTLATVPVAVGDKDGEAQWVRVALFGDMAKELAPRLTKGAKAYFEGTLTLNHYEDRNGAQRSGLNMAANICQPVGQIGRRRSARRKTADEAQAPFSGGK